MATWVKTCSSLSIESHREIYFTQTNRTARLCGYIARSRVFLDRLVQLQDCQYQTPLHKGHRRGLRPQRAKLSRPYS